jgi:hypothetical protein
MPKYGGIIFRIKSTNKALWTSNLWCFIYFSKKSIYIKMRKIILTTLFLTSILVRSQKTENLIIITTDGFRWQEVFKGLDPKIADDKSFSQGDHDRLYKDFWSDDATVCRAKLMPFLWSEIAKNGQIYGNRDFGNKVNNANPFWFSYPGYSEIMTGFADPAINSNHYKANPNTTVLEFLNKQPKLKGKIAAFGAWDAFDRILNEERSGIPVISAFDKVGKNKPTEHQKLLNAMLADSFKPFHDEECLDVFTHYEALDALKNQKPKVLYIAYGETDEWAHAGRYNSYIDAAHQVDAWIKQIWEFVQNDPQYKGKTTLIFTTDHGRGDVVKSEWTSHGSDIKGASEIWFAAMGPEITAKGEVKTDSQIYQQQLAQTIAKLLGYTFEANHPIADEIHELTVLRK